MLRKRSKLALQLASKGQKILANQHKDSLRLIYSAHLKEVTLKSVKCEVVVDKQLFKHVIFNSISSTSNSLIGS